MKYRRYDFGELFWQGTMGVIILLGIGLLVFCGHLIYGRVTQEDIVTVHVVDKEIDSGMTCVFNGKVTVCTPYTTHTIYSQDDQYEIDPELYDDVIVGRTHSFHVVGWDYSKYIDEVLE